MTRMVAIVAAVAVLSLTSRPTLRAEEQAASPGPPTAEAIRFFESKIRPLLASHCNDCHGADLQESELRLDSLAGMMTGGKAGPAIVPGKPASSLQNKRISGLLRGSGR